MTIYLLCLLGFMGLVIVLACFPSKEERASWHTPEGFGKQPMTKKGAKS